MVKKIGKKGLEIDMIGWILIGIIFLFIAIVIIMTLNGKTSGAIGKILEMFRFGK